MRRSLPDRVVRGDLTGLCGQPDNYCRTRTQIIIIASASVCQSKGAPRVTVTIAMHEPRVTVTVTSEQSALSASTVQRQGAVLFLRAPVK